MPDGTYIRQVSLPNLKVKNSLSLVGDVTLHAALEYAKIVYIFPYLPLRMLWLAFVYSAKMSGYCNFHTVLVGVRSNRLKISTAIFQHLFTNFLFLDLTVGFRRWLYQHHPPGPCLCGLVTLNSKTITMWLEICCFSSLRFSCVFLLSSTLIDSAKALQKLVYRNFLSRVPISEFPDTCIPNHDS